jgi:hypothetical protein
MPKSSLPVVSVSEETIVEKIYIIKQRRTRKPPYAFIEQGVAMLSSVVNSGSAIQVNIQSSVCLQK